VNPAEWVVPYFFTRGQTKRLKNTSLCLEYQMKYKVQKSSNVKYNRPLSEYFRMNNTVIITVILGVQHIDPITAHILYQWWFVMTCFCMSCKWNPRLDQSVQNFFLFTLRSSHLLTDQVYLIKSITVGNRNTPGVTGVSEIATAVDTVNTEGTIRNNLFENKLDMSYKKVSYSDTKCW